MRRVRLLGLLAPLLLACCALPPRVEDRGSPEQAYRTFRGALARGEHAREWECLSDALRERLGIRRRAEWMDARAIVLHQRHPLVRALVRSEIRGEARPEPDGRALLELRFPLGYAAQLWMRPVPVLRAYVEGRAEPPVYLDLDAIVLEAGPDRISVLVPPGDMADVAHALPAGTRIRRFEAAVEWFLDDFATEEDNPESVRRDLDARQEQP